MTGLAAVAITVGCAFGGWKLGQRAGHSDVEAFPAFGMLFWGVAGCLAGVAAGVGVSVAAL